MDLIIGGAYQGKLAYAKEKYHLTDAAVFTCTENTEISFDARCIYGIQEYTLRCVKEGTDALEVFRNNKSKWQNSILICEDIFCGVVPLGKEMRAWREMTGRLCAYLSEEAESVTRLFCGLAQTLK